MEKEWKETGDLWNGVTAGGILGRKHKGVKATKASSEKSTHIQKGANQVGKPTGTDCEGRIGIKKIIAHRNDESPGGNNDMGRVENGKDGGENKIGKGSIIDPTIVGDIGKEMGKDGKPTSDTRAGFWEVSGGKEVTEVIRNTPYRNTIINKWAGTADHTHTYWIIVDTY